MLWYDTGAWVKGESPPRRPSDTAWESYPGVVRPTRTAWPSTTLCGYCAGRPVSFDDTVRLTPILLHVAPLERGRWHPRKGYDHLPYACLGRRHDIRPAERASSVTFGPVRPSPPLCRHPTHCSVIPNTVGPRPMGHRHACRCAASGLSSTQPSNWHADGDQTRAPALLPSKPPLDGHRIRHDARQRQDSSGRLSLP
jgi:hypothetical protein